MTEARSKRRILPLVFIVKSFKKPLLIRQSIKMSKNNTANSWTKGEFVEIYGNLGLANFSEDPITDRK